MDYFNDTADLQTKVFINFDGSIKTLGNEFAKRYPGSGAFVVCDNNTRRAAGNEVVDILKMNNINVHTLILEEESEHIIEPEYATVKKIIKKFPKEKCIPIAVGSGTINDLVKRAAYEKNIPYVCIPTASSVDGYCSFGAALTVNGFKTTIDCSAPEMVIADANILKTAPISMSSAGYGDLYSKHTAGTDWIIADMMGAEAIDEKIWGIVHKDLRHWLHEPEKILQGESNALSKLFEGLSATGIAMQMYGNSRPASGLEHMVSHIWEMSKEERGLEISHGYQVSVGILISTAITESFLDYPVESLDIEKEVSRREGWEERKKLIHRLFLSPQIAKRVEEVCRSKWLDDKKLTRHLSLLKDKWPDIKVKIKENMVSFDEAKMHLMKAGCPSGMEEIGLPRDSLRESVIRAQMIRDRYILLEAVYHCGLMKEILDNIETYF